MHAILAAHIRDDHTVQSIKAHLEGVAELAKKYADCFHSGDYAYLCGLLHDIGKYSEKFQRRIYEGGKTISSLAFSLKHAQKHKMDRVIYVILYNSIINRMPVFSKIVSENKRKNVKFGEIYNLKYKFA